LHLIHHSAKLNAALIWNPSPSQLWQQFTITAHIEDDDGRRTPDIQFTVIGVPPVTQNSAAQFTGEPIVTSPWNKYDVKLEPEIPTFSLSFDSGPLGMAERLGTVYWTPMGTQAGKHCSYYFISDGSGHSGFLPMRWVVRRGSPPQWWFPTVIDGNFQARDYAAVTVGQVRNIAQMARAHFEARGVTPEEMQTIDLAIDLFAQSKSHAAVNIGQLKAISAPFYETMSARDYLLSPTVGGFIYPWNQASTGNFTLANIGQAKSLFSFSLSSLPQAQVARPMFTPLGGVSNFPVTVEIANATLGSKIYYTIDGTVPTPASSEYTGQFTLSDPAVVKAIGTRIGWIDSEIASTEYTSVVATPEISPSGGAFASPVAVTISTSTPNATLRYTTNGTFPSNGQNGTPPNGNLVNASTATFNLPVSTTPVVVRAISSRINWDESAVAEATFTQLTLPSPELTPEYRGVQSFPVVVGYSNSNDMPLGTVVRYTTNGSNPTNTSSVLPASGTSISAPLNYVTVKARAFLNGAISSPIVTAEFHKFAVNSAVSTTTQTTVSLSTIGTTDWIHWGDTIGTQPIFAPPVRKSGVLSANQIGTYLEFGVIGGETVIAPYTTDLRGKSWSSGTPTAIGTNNKNGSKITRTGLAPSFGFDFTAPAIASARTLKIYSGGFKLTGRLVAKWSNTQEVIYVGPPTGNATVAFESLFTVNYVAPPSKVGSNIVFTWQSSTTVNGSEIWLSGATLSTQ
jgi:hypothetical protein